MRFARKILPVLPSLAVGLVVLGPLLGPGFVLTMDMVFTPELRPPDHIDNTFLMYWPLYIVNAVLPADVIQKLLLLGIFVGGGFGVYRLLDSLKHNGRLWLYAAQGASLIYVCNPFVYDRLMAGQYGVLLGYAFLPWFARAFIGLTNAPTARRAIAVAAWLVGVSIVSIHTIGFALLIAAGLAWLAWPNIKDKMHFGRRIVLVFGLFIAASAYWIAPAMLGQGRIADSVQTFSSSQRHAFATADTNGETSLGAVLSLQGFWQDTRGLYILPIDFTPQWGFVRLAILAVIGVGIWRAWHVRRREAVAFLGVGIVAIVLALDIVGDFFAATIPFFAGYREPQKFVALLALCYAYFAAWGLFALLWRAAQWRQWSVYPVCAGFVALVFAFTSPLLFGAQGQLRAAAYPSDWQVVNDRLNSDGRDFAVLYLPWHLYMSYDFAGRIIASPAPDYFDKPMIVSDDPELAGVSPQFHNATKQDVGQVILPAAAKGQDIAPLLRKHGIEYVLVTKELDYKNYDSLLTQPNLQNVMQTEHFYVYQVK